MTSSVVVMVVVAEEEVTLEQVFPAIAEVSVMVLVSAGLLQYESRENGSVFGTVVSEVVMLVSVLLLNDFGSESPTIIRNEVGEMDFVILVWILLVLMVFISILTVVVSFISRLLTSLLLITCDKSRTLNTLLLFIVVTVIFSSV